MFKPPTLNQIRQYARQEKIDVKYLNPMGFFCHYESNGWMVGKTKMKRWRAAAKGWAIRNGWTPPEKRSAQNERYLEEKHKKDRETYGDWLKAKNAKALEDLLKDPGQVPKWLVEETLRGLKEAK